MILAHGVAWRLKDAIIIFCPLQPAHHRFKKQCLPPSSRCLSGRCTWITPGRAQGYHVKIPVRAELVALRPPNDLLGNALEYCMLRMYFSQSDAGAGTPNGNIIICIQFWASCFRCLPPTKIKTFLFRAKDALRKLPKL